MAYRGGVNMCIISSAWALAAITFVSSFVAISLAATPSLDPVAAALERMATKQKMLELPIRVVDADGKPVAEAKIAPWALRCSQGHGWWRENDERAGAGPKSVVTGDDGTALVLYPRYRDFKEQIQTISVSL